MIVISLIRASGLRLRSNSVKPPTPAMYTIVIRMQKLMMSVETPPEMDDTGVLYGRLQLLGAASSHFGRNVFRDDPIEGAGACGDGDADSSEDYRVTPGQLHQFPLYPLCD